MGGLICACANLGAPTGGPADEAPPELLATFPPDQTTNFKGQSIQLVFDEWIAVNNLNKNLQISPLTENKYRYTQKKNILILEFEQPLDTNTTYTLNFGEAITDITEKNKALNIRLAFSTGAFIDSLRMTGQVRDLLTHKALKGVAVLLYNAEDSLDIRKSKPLYLTQADTAGRYTLTNIKAGVYRAYALVEKTANFIYDKSEEQIAFLPAPVTIAPPAGLEQDFETLTYDLDTLRLRSGRRNKQLYELKFSKPFQTYNVRLDSAYDTTVYHIGKEEYITFFYRNLQEPDSLSATIAATDAVGRRVDTTLMLYFEPAKRPQDIPFTQIEEPTSGNKFVPQSSVATTLRFSKPIHQMFVDSIAFKSDRDTAWQAVSDTLLGWNHNRTELTLRIPSGFDSAFVWQLKAAAFISVENDTSQLQTINYTTKAAGDFGVIAGQVVGIPSDTHFILQLISAGKVEQELYDARTFRFTYVSPGKKTFRILLDTNGNRQWDKGDIRFRILPEPVFFPPNQIDLKANWEIEGEQIQVQLN